MSNDTRAPLIDFINTIRKMSSDALGYDYTKCDHGTGGKSLASHGTCDICNDAYTKQVEDALEAIQATCDHVLGDLGADAPEGSV